MKDKIFKNDPSDAELKGMYSCEESRNHTQDISMNEKTFVETRGTHLCAIFLVKPVRDQWSDIPRSAIFLVKPDITIQDRALGSGSDIPPFFPIQPPVCRFTLKLRMLRSAINFNRGISCRKKSACAVVQEWKALLDMQNIGLGMQTAASDACHSKFP